MNLETKITIYKFTPQLFTLTHFFPFIKHCLFTSIRHSNCKLPLIQHPFIAATACINSQCPLGIIPSHRNFSISTVLAQRKFLVGKF